MSEIGVNASNLPKDGSNLPRRVLSQKAQIQLNINDTIRQVKTRGEMLAQHEAQLKRIGSSVEALDLHDLPNLTTQDLTVLTRCCPHVSRLNIKQSKLSPTSIAELGKFSKLESLDIGKTMKTLNLQNIPLTTEQIAVLVRNCPNVTNVKLKNCNLTNLSVIELAKLTNLEALDINDNRALTGAMLASISSLAMLKEVTVTGCVGLVDFGAHLPTFDMAVQRAIKKLLESKMRRVPPLPLTAEEKTILNIIKRCEQLSKASIEIRPLAEQDLIQLAYFVEVRLPVEVAKGVSLFTKAAYKLPRSLQYSKKAGGTVYLFANHKVAKLKAKGSTKIVSSAAQFCLNEYSQTPAPYARGLTKSKLTGTEVSQIRQEITRTKKIVQEIRKRFPNEPLGVVPVHTVRDFTNLKSISRLSLLSPAFDGDCFVLLERNDKPSRKNLVRLADGCARGLHQLHALGYAYGDLKNENCVFKENPATGEIEEARLIDFGFTFHTLTEAEDDMKGYYGTVYYTSPEQFGVSPFKGDFMKTDIFAFGVTFYLQFHRKLPPWAELIGAYNEGEGEADLALVQAKVKQSVKETIEVPLWALGQKKSRTADEQFQYLIYQTLRLDPAQRIDMATFRKELAKIPV